MTDAELRSAASATEDPGLAVSIQDLDVKYRVYEDLRVDAKALFKRRFRTRSSVVVHALKGVSFDIRVGEAVGIVGSNGSGKSTLLRAIAGLQAKESGRVLVRGEASLLGVGATLKPQLSGNRNVILGGLAMGMRREDVRALLPDVAEFSGLGKAMNRPMKTYSSGMKARLAFSVATLRVPDILLVDEALAVGDRNFRRRSLNRLNEIRDNAGTIVMVTHNLNEIRKTCTRAVWLEQGELVLDGPVDDVLGEYEERGL